MARRANTAWLPILAAFLLLTALPASVSNSSSTIAFKTSTSATTGAGANSLSISAPSGLASGDVLICQIVANGASTAITAPGGWVQIQRTPSTSSVVMASYYRLAGSNEPTSYTFNFDSPQPVTAGIADYTGVDPAHIIDAASSLYNPNTSTANFSQVTTTRTNDLLVALVGVTANTTVTPPPNFVERYNLENSTSPTGKTAVLSDMLEPVAGVTVVQPAQESSNVGSNVTQLIALSPMTTSTATVTPSSTAITSSTPTQTMTPTNLGSIASKGQTTASNGTGSTNLTIAVPTGLTSGDLILAQIVVNDAATLITPPTGWILILRTQSTSSVAMGSYYKLAGNSEPVGYSFTFSSPQPATGGIADYSGVSATNSVDTSSGQYNPNTATVTFAPVTTAYANDLLVALVAVTANTRVTPPANFVERYDINNSASSNGKTAELSDMLDLTSGNITIGTASETSDAGSNLAQLIALRPMSGSTPTSTLAPTATPVVTPIATSTPGSDPVLAIGGDIACDPTDPGFNNGSGSGTACQMRTTGALVGSSQPTLLLALGDEQYENGALSAFQQSYDPTWGTAKSITRPVPGNHEYNTAGASGYYNYFGASAGDPSRGYYSFDLGGWHLVALNGECANIGGCASGSPEEQWLKADLTAHPGLCTLAYWHEPRFSSGIGGNDPDYTDFWRDLYSAGAELIINGHEHLYERFAPQDPDGNSDPARGVVELEVGTGGSNLFAYSVIQPNSVVRNNVTFGILLVTLHSSGYEWRFVPTGGQTFTDTGAATCH